MKVVETAPKTFRAAPIPEEAELPPAEDPPPEGTEEDESADD